MARSGKVHFPLILVHDCIHFSLFVATVGNLNFSLHLVTADATKFVLYFWNASSLYMYSLFRNFHEVTRRLVQKSREKAECFKRRSRGKLLESVPRRTCHTKQVLRQFLASFRLTMLLAVMVTTQDRLQSVNCSDLMYMW